MPKAVFIDAKGGEFELDVPVGQTLMEAATDAMLDGIIGECGGVMSCATCHVYVDPAWVTKLQPADDIEESMIDVAREPQENSRLSCQITMSEELDGIVVHMPRSQF
ncbi:2Fe-2S iron-sulfur cluster binding domain-containing protein [Aliidiomarina halalkaliphila]|uniref:2Fe-2S iron-sulfur cluster binding domain-containing protein n=1 Tax=Aliidiomarina halalkaliphila TaxID=2593535 RepID=A0A552X377_9GAMM|nr:2Fe-2S iron-sulfur cluster-binding protein [Aliidiomarina halalkaliphila]TRW49494.1 2Fe-2S iron-sulfur cluster binding domain-containing protein [Aliidiomarina halalkaliphila]